MSAHHSQCEWHLDQYDRECTCGLTRPEAPWFRGLVERAAQDRFDRAAAALAKATTANSAGMSEANAPTPPVKTGEG